MLQRLQTLYLFAAAAFLAVLFFFPLVRFLTDGGEFELFAFALKNGAGETAQTTLHIGVVVALCSLLSGITIFLYKRRPLQMLLCKVNMLLLIAVSAVLGAYYFLLPNMLPELSLQGARFSPSVFFLGSAMFAIYLAYRSIRRDEMMVRAADRIR